MLENIVRQLTKIIYCNKILCAVTKIGDKIMKENSILSQIKSLEKLIVRNITGIGIQNIEAIPTPTQMQIIKYILENNDKEVYQRDLEKVLNLRRATVSGVLQTMEKNNLIKRVTDTNDTRTKRIILNEETKNIFFTYRKKVSELELKITSGISKDELKIFSSVIDKMKENVKNLN